MSSNAFDRIAAAETENECWADRCRQERADASLRAVAPDMLAALRLLHAKYFDLLDWADCKHIATLVNRAEGVEP